MFLRIAKFNHHKDYYTILNIPQKNDQKTIKKAYYTLPKKFIQILIKEVKKSLRKLMKPMKYLLIIIPIEIIIIYEIQQSEQAFNQASQNQYYQQLYQQYQQNAQRNNQEEDMRRKEEVLNQFAQEALFRKQREYQARQQYYEYEKRKNQFYYERVKRLMKIIQDKKNMNNIKKKNLQLNKANSYKEYQPKILNQVFKTYIKIGINLNQMQVPYGVVLKKRKNEIQQYLILSKVIRINFIFISYIYWSSKKIFFKMLI